ncbi:MAG: hypothetical protein HFE86_08440 [Clostridiales bacterium]|nr:hypothetical protein [Clostridiales bacterium]
MSFRLFGVSFEITVPFCLVLVFTLLTDRTGLMSYMLLAVLLHEGGHLLAMACCDALPKAVRLRAGRVSIEKSGRLLGRKEEAAVAAAGPLVNLLCAGAGLLVYTCWGGDPAALFGAVHMLFALFNLLPVTGLDGGTLCFLLVCSWWGEERARRFTRLLSWLFAAVVLLTGLLLVLRGNPSLLFTGVYLLVLQTLKGGREP